MSILIFRRDAHLRQHKYEDAHVRGLVLIKTSRLLVRKTEGAICFWMKRPFQKVIRQDVVRSVFGELQPSQMIANLALDLSRHTFARRGTIDRTNYGAFFTSLLNASEPRPPDAPITNRMS
jgi:hypothetical protein